MLDAAVIVGGEAGVVVMGPSFALGAFVSVGGVKETGKFQGRPVDGSSKSVSSRMKLPVERLARLLYS
jgi:hypothetical protein